MAEAEVHVLERICVAPATGTPSPELPITFFDDVAWLFTDPVERLFYRHIDPAAAFPLPAAFLPYALTRFFPLTGTLSPAARCFSYSSGYDALDLLHCIQMDMVVA